MTFRSPARIDRPLYIGSEVYRRSSYGASHPLAVPRVSTCTDICRAMGWLPDAQFVEAPMATEAQIARFHDVDYLRALQRAEATQSVDAAIRDRYRIGTDNNPVYPEIWRRPATSAGGVMLAARLTVDGGVVHCPGGGTHHGRRDRASGFCYLNDPVLLILTWLDLGLRRIAYVDLDAHHGDGVQDAFHDDPRVLTLSIHEDGRWPRTGAEDDRAGGAARNLPVPRGLNDTEHRWLIRRAVLPLVAAHAPDGLVVQTGADSLEEDPLAKLSLSNNAYFEAVRALVPAAPRVVVVGGGGYNPYTVGRCWAGIWATLNEHPIPPSTTPGAEAVLRALRYNRAAGRNPPAHWFTTIRDQPREGPVRDEIRRLADNALKETVPA
jgi:acetoin utilization protein AcuC